MMVLILAALFMLGSATVSASDAGLVDTDAFSLENMRRGIGLPMTLAGFDEEEAKYTRQVEGVQTYERSHKYFGQFRIMRSGKVILYRPSGDEGKWKLAATIGAGDSIDWNKKEVLDAIENNILAVMSAEAELSFAARA